MGWPQVGAVAALLALITFQAPAAEAGIPVSQTVRCPIDGRTFTHTTTASYSTWGSHLDGLPMGSWAFPLALPQCPDSRFPVFREFETSETEELRRLVATPEYQAIANERSYYVLSHVMRALGEGEPLDWAWHVLQASWQARGDPALYRRYAAELIPMFDAALPAVLESEPGDWWYYQTILANVSRQAGDFGAATARLDALEGEPPLPVLSARIALTRELIAARDSAPRAFGDRAH